MAMLTIMVTALVTIHKVESPCGDTVCTTIDMSLLNLITLLFPIYLLHQVIGPAYAFSCESTTLNGQARPHATLAQPASRALTSVPYKLWRTKMTTTTTMIEEID